MSTSEARRWSVKFNKTAPTCVVFPTLAGKEAELSNVARRHEIEQEAINLFRRQSGMRNSKRRKTYERGIRNAKRPAEQARTYLKIIEKEVPSQTERQATITDVTDLKELLEARFGAVLPEQRQWMRELWAKAA